MTKSKSWNVNLIDTLRAGRRGFPDLNFKVEMFRTSDAAKEWLDNQ